MGKPLTLRERIIKVFYDAGASISLTTGSLAFLCKTDPRTIQAELDALVADKVLVRGGWHGYWKPAPGFVFCTREERAQRLAAERAARRAARKAWLNEKAAKKARALAAYRRPGRFPRACMNAERREVSEFVTYVKTQYGAEWHVRHVFYEKTGWAVEWRVNDRQVTMSPKTARQCAREIEDGFRKAFARKSEQDRAVAQFSLVMSWLKKFDDLAKQALHFNREGVLPPQTA